MTEAMTSRRGLRLSTALAGLAVLAGCGDSFDFDLRGRMGDNFSTAEAARTATADRPDPDDRGVISYPGYQVAVARRGDTLADVAARVGLPAGELARYNGIKPEDTLRRGEIVALPRRVEEPSPETGAVGTGPILPPAQVDVTELASAAIDSAAPTPPRPAARAEPKPQTGLEPIRHKVARGETAFTISRLYNVSVRSLADWNGLGSDYALREGQYLLIPVAEAAPPAGRAPLDATTTTAAAAPEVTAPGQGSPTPVPPSASRPLPAETPPPAATPPAPVQAPDLGTTPSAAKPASTSQMTMPVQGSIIREYAKGRNDGIDISAPVGTPVKAAASGVVAAITSDADNIPIIVVKHPDNLLTVYANLGDIAVRKDDRVSRGQPLGKIRQGSPPYVHFEVRRGFDSVDPLPFVQ